MSTDPFAELRRQAGPPDLPAPPRLSSPPIAATLEGLDPAVVESGAWHDDFLLLGSRLGAVYDEELELDEFAPAYLIAHDTDTKVQVSCPVGAGRADRVRVAAAVLTLAADTKGLFEFALRENARLALAQLCFEDDQLVASYELPFIAAGLPALEAAIMAVGSVAARLRPELVAGYLPPAA